MSSSPLSSSLNCSYFSSTSSLIFLTEARRCCASKASSAGTTTSANEDASAAFTAFAGVDPAHRAEVSDVANCFRARETNRIPLGRVIHDVSPGTKAKIFKSGKGLEGYLRQFPSAFIVEKIGNDKFLTLVDERLREQCASVAAPASPQIKARMSLERLAELDDVRRTHIAKARGLPLPEKAAPGNAKLIPVVKDDSKKDAWTDAVSATTTTGTADSAENADAEAAADGAGEDESAASQQQQQQQPATDATGKPLPDAGDVNKELMLRVRACLPGENQWYRVVAVHNSLYRGTTVQVAPFLAFLRNAPKYFWVDADGDFVCRRLPYHTAPPPNLKSIAMSKAEREDRLAALFSPTGRRSNSNNSNNSSGGGAASSDKRSERNSEWGDVRNAPTSQDVYEILRYIPIHWTEFGGLQMPDVVRKKHIRIASKLTWFARQPRFFDLRWIGGTCEIRRAPVLHPTEHNLTKEEAEKLLQARIEEDARYGQPLVLLQARGHHTAGLSVSLPATMDPARAVAAAQQAASSSSSSSKPAAESKSSTVPDAPAAPAAPVSTMSVAINAATSSSANVEAVQKALVRIAPGYFITSDAVIRRATKKMSDDDLLLAAEKMPLMVERLFVRSKTNPRHTLSLYRRKLGVDESMWKPAFVEELENSPNLQLLGVLMTHLCAQWDRTHFLYVRLPDSGKIATGGFDDMVAFMRQHPNAFRMGEFFVKRNDLSDPTSADADPEPTSKIVMTTKQLEDNPYHQLIDLASVFHYLTPETDSVSLSHYVDASSPAMRSVLPPRILTILQAYPEMFNCREVAPGSFAVSRAQTGAHAEQEAALNTMTKDDAVQQLVAIIPPRGVDIAHLEATMPQQLRRAIVRLFGAGGVASLVHEYAARFHLVRNPPYTTVFVRKQ